MSEAAYRHRHDALLAIDSIVITHTLCDLHRSTVFDLSLQVRDFVQWTSCSSPTK